MLSGKWGATEDNYGVGGFQTEENGAIVVVVSDRDTMEGSPHIFENKEVLVAKNELDEAITKEKFKICTTNEWTGFGLVLEG